MFPWQGEGKATSFLLATQQREQRQQQAQQQVQQQSAQQDNGYGRWRLPSVMQDSAGSGQVVNDKVSSNHTSSAGAGGRASSSTREEPLARPESLTASVSGEDQEDDEEDGDQGESDGEDIDFRSSTRSEANPTAAPTTDGAEQQARQPGQRLGERMPPLGYPPQSSSRNNHARRLNTEEEIKLFELCIKHSSTFGERSKLCEWWKNIANEFIENYGGPYSWHSVRRKVDLVTRQRIKYLADLKEGKIEADQATDPWKKVLDEWIPTWEKFEMSEKRRIEVRDQRAAMRKRKEPPVAASGSSPSSPAPSSSTPAAKRKSNGATTGAAAPGSWQATPSKWIPNPSPYGPATYPTPPGLMAPPPSTPGMKMPDGYDTMFRSPAHPTTHPLYPYPPPQPYYPPPMAAPPAVDSNLTSAVLETLTKLNKHLEKADGTSTVVAALTSNKDDNANEKTATENETSSSSLTLPADADTEGPQAQSEKIIYSPATFQNFKTELRAEFETELAKLRDAFTQKLDSLEQAQEMIMDMLRQEPGREGLA